MTRKGFGFRGFRVPGLRFRVLKGAFLVMGVPCCLGQGGP